MIIPKKTVAASTVGGTSEEGKDSRRTRRSRSHKLSSQQKEKETHSYSSEMSATISDILPMYV